MKDFDAFVAAVDFDAITDAAVEAMERSFKKQSEIDKTEGTRATVQSAATITAIHVSTEVSLQLLRAYHEWAQG